MSPKIIAENVNSIFSLPEVAIRINELMNSGEASSDNLEEIIIHDPALTAKLLKLANSPYFGFSRKIDTVSHAISLIGHKELRNLVIATSVTSTFKDIPPDLVDMEAFWYHSVTCGVMARLFAAQTNIKEQERFFIAGLLQGIGKLIFFSQYPTESKKILSLKDQGEAAIRNAEVEIFGFTHAQLSAEFLKQWQLPSSIWKMIEFQFDPLNENAPIKDSCILHVAENIASCIEPCASRTVSMDEIKPTYHIEAWNQLGLSPEITQTIIGKAGLQILEMLGIIKPEAIMIY
jgi:HD-like signal output (HDOD) protein